MQSYDDLFFSLSSSQLPSIDKKKRPLSHPKIHKEKLYSAHPWLQSKIFKRFCKNEMKWKNMH